jgi:hypothetical protein
VLDRPVFSAISCAMVLVASDTVCRQEMGFGHIGLLSGNESLREFEQHDGLGLLPETEIHSRVPSLVVGQADLRIEVDFIDLDRVLRSHEPEVGAARSDLVGHGPGHQPSYRPPIRRIKVRPDPLTENCIPTASTVMLPAKTPSIRDVWRAPACPSHR